MTQSAYIKKEKWSPSNNIICHCKKIEMEQIKPKVSERKETMKIKAESMMQKTKTTEKDQ